MFLTEHETFTGADKSKLKSNRDFPFLQRKTLKCPFYRKQYRKLADQLPLLYWTLLYTIR